MDEPFRAAVITVSDGVHAGERADESGEAVARLLQGAGFEVVQRAVVPDEREDIQQAVRDVARIADLVVTTGGTGLGPRDVTPEATRAVLDREAPGLAEAMRAAGSATTPMAALSRGVAGALGETLVLNLPGSPSGATESLQAILPALGHALETLGGHTAHVGAVAREARPAGGPRSRPSTGVDEELRGLTESGEAVVVATAVRIEGRPPCAPGQKLLIGPDGPLAGTLGCAEFDEAAVRDARAVLAAGEPAVQSYHHELGSVDVYLDPRFPHPLLVVLGATPVALWLLRWGEDMGYDTVLVEPRTERVRVEHREAAGYVVRSPEEAEPHDEVDAVHTDHDAPAVAEHLAVLLRAGARFVGVMGSSRHVGLHLDQLREMGFDEADLARVRTPVGLDIGSRTPQEIALSILAGLVSARTGRAGGWLDAEARRS